MVFVHFTSDLVKYNFVLIYTKIYQILLILLMDQQGQGIKQAYLEMSI